MSYGCINKICKRDDNVQASRLTSEMSAALTPTEIELQISSIIGTVNWTVYELLIVREEPLAPSVLTAKLIALFLR